MTTITRARPVPLDTDGIWYQHPTTDERFLRVTSALEATPKEGLPPWAAGLAAAGAFAELPRVVAASRISPCGRTHNRCSHDWREICADCPCGDCRACVEKGLRDYHWVEKQRRADEGTRTHKAIEQWVLAGGVWPTADDDIRPYLAAFSRFARDYGLTPDNWEMTEATIINRTDSWGGTLDGQLRIRWGVTEAADDFCARLGHTGGDVVVTADTKTRERPGVRLYESHAMQLAAYRRGEVILFRDGTEEPLPPTDGGAILQLRPDDDGTSGYSFRPVVTDDSTYAAFVGALTTYRWCVDHGPAAIAAKSFPLPEDYKRGKANRKARERRACAKAAALAAPTPSAVASQPGQFLRRRVAGIPADTDIPS